MAAEIITKEDLQEFGKTLLNQIRGLLGQSFEEPKKWLKTYQVKNLLKISDNTLQTLRDNGTIPFTKIGGILYYNYEDINRVLSGEIKSKRIKIGKQSKAA
ncbi:MAG: helix-turn-helix domain-containing protein [Bacteroidota bacterium]